MNKGVSLNTVLLAILGLLLLFLSGTAIYLGILSRKNNNNSTGTSSGTETPRAFPTTPAFEGKKTQLLIDSPEKGGKILFIQGTVDSFDGTNIEVSWEGDTDTIRLWGNSTELRVSYGEQQGQVVKKGELTLNNGDYVMYKVEDKLLFIKPK